jgi:hypothetical protein
MNGEARKTIDRLGLQAYQRSGACLCAHPIIVAIPERLPEPDIDFDQDNRLLIEWSDSPHSHRGLLLAVNYQGRVDWAMRDGPASPRDEGAAGAESRQGRDVTQSGHEETVASFLAANIMGQYEERIQGG